MTAIPEYHLFIDDSGSRDPDRRPKHSRDDRMDCFALGGILIKAEDIDDLKRQHADFCARHDITYPLHSNPIRGGRENFGWLKTPEKARIFFRNWTALCWACPYWVLHL